MDAMERWRASLNAQLQSALLDDEDEDQFVQILVNQTALDLEFEESKRKKRKHGGSRMGKRPNLDRQRQVGQERILRDYFSETPVYDDNMFRRRFRMRRALFLRIMHAVIQHDSYFTQKRDAAGVLGLSSIQKCYAALRILACGAGGNANDEYCRLGESTAMEALKRFVKAIRACFESTYLRQPTLEDLRKQMHLNEHRGFPGMFASIDCMYWNWKNCPVAWQHQFPNKDASKRIVVEAIVDQSMWIWHAFFGLPGGNNDINVLDRSPLVLDMVQGKGSELNFSVNGSTYPSYYLLADGIYPRWSCFVQTIQEPQGEKQSHFAAMQESICKDVERCFGILQSRFGIIHNPCKLWDLGAIYDIMMACVIMHNMIIEDELNSDLEPLFEPSGSMARLRNDLSSHEFMQGPQEFENSDVFHSLRDDLIEHLWALKCASMY